MEDLKQARFEEEKTRYKAWFGNLVTEALEKEAVEDYLYEHRWEFYDENSKRLRACLYPLWAARVNESSKEDMEALYWKGYRFIHKLTPNCVVLEIIDYNWKKEEEYTEESVVSDGIYSVIVETIEDDRFPAMLLTEYDQVEQHLKEKVRCRLFVKMMDEYKAETDEGIKQEEFLQKMEQLFPAVYKDFMGISVTELLFSIREKVETCAKYIERYLEIHKEDVERMQAWEEYLSRRHEK